MMFGVVFDLLMWCLGCCGLCGFVRYCLFVAYSD